jgi:hypothetical protein
VFAVYKEESSKRIGESKEKAKLKGLVKMSGLYWVRRACNTSL